MTLKEAERLHALKSYAVLDTLAEGRFDRITELAADIFGTPIALLSLLDETRQWFKARVGLSERETPRDWAFCNHAIAAGPGGLLVVPDAESDPRFEANPLVVGPPGIRFYAGAVITSSDGYPLGTLCILDTVPRPGLNASESHRLRLLAQVAMDELELTRATRVSEARFDLLQMAESMSGVGHFRYTVGDGRVSWSDEVFRIHGVDRATFDPNLGEAITFYHEDDQAAVTQAVSNAVAHQEDFDFQLRLRRADGALRQVRSKGTCEVDGLGRTTAVVGVFQDVHEHWRQVEELQRSEGRYRLLADHMADVVTRINLDGSSSYISPAVEALIGWTPTEMRGQTAQAFVHGDDRALILEAFRELSAGLARRTIEHRVLHKAGHEVWVETRFTLVRGEMGDPREFVAVIRDISKRKASALALAESDGRYQFLAEHANDMIARMKPGGEIVLVTPGCEQVLGYRPEELIGKRTLDFMHRGDLPMVADYFAQLERLGPGGMLDPYQFRAQHKAGHWVWLEGQPKIFFDGDSGEPNEVQDVVRDISSRKSLELELDHARGVAEAATAAKSSFLANMSHEIRTPLNGVLGYADVLAETVLTPDQSRYVDRIRTAGHGLSALVNDILDFSRMEAGKMPVSKAPFNLRAVAEEVVALTEQSAGGRLAFRVSFDQNISPWLIGDEQRTRQILLNLLGNAAKFTLVGSVELEVSLTDATLELRINDTGIGIEASGLSHLFDGFAQADASVGRQFGGSGLGLSISRSLARLMGGDVTLESQIGLGTTATFALPYQPVAHTSPVELTPQRSTGRSSRRLDVLVVDDLETNRELMEIVLAGLGHTVTCEASGMAALARLTSGAACDLVLMDVQMPEMDGLETTRRIRRLRAAASGVPIVALTADVMPEQIQACFDAGMTGHLHKPVRRPDLIDVLDRFGKTVVLRDAGSTVRIASDPLAELGARYQLRLAALRAEFAGLFELPLDKRALAVRDVAHQIAGTAGSFGFPAVSEAAFRVEEEAKRACDQGKPETILRERVTALLDAVSVALANAAVARPIAASSDTSPHGMAIGGAREKLTT